MIFDRQHSELATALVVATTLNDVPVPNGSFEAPSVGANVVPHPAGATWTFEGDAGIAGNGSGFANAPDGTQVGYVQNNTGVIRQTVALTAGTYALAFKAAQGPANKTPQQVRVTIEKTGLPTTVLRFVWSGNTIAEERDSTGATVTKRYFVEGEWRMNAKGDGKLYYTRDHLGSIREVTNSSGVLQARYDYDVWGNSVVLSGSMNLDFGYTGHYFHAPSGLNLSLFRPYIPPLGRWLNRDPIGETGGLNLYGYVGNDPVNYRDPLGLIEDSATQSLAQAIARGSSEEIQLMLDTQPQLSTEAQALGKAAVDKLRSTAGDLIAKNCKGSINRVFPDQLREKTFEQISNLAKQGDKIAQTAKKLLTDARFQK